MKVRNIVYDEKPLQQAVFQETIIWATHERRDNGVEHLNFFNKVISKLLAVDVKIDEEDKVLILISSLLESYDHIIATILYDKETLILKEITSTLLSNEIIKRPNQVQREGYGLVVMGRKEREEKKSSVRRRRVTFIKRKVTLQALQE